MSTPFKPVTLIEREFTALSAIPRPSGHEQAAAAYVRSVASRLNLRYYADDMSNVIVYVPASPGRESEPPVMLQAHLDMVTVAAPGVRHDFLGDPLRLVVHDGRLMADGTTLGADDGYGCAYMLAAMQDDFPHPPLECVFTTQEENGCYGAQALDTSRISARRMIGLDVMGEPIENTCCVSCYCSNRMIVTAQCAIEKAQGNVHHLSLTGIQPVRAALSVHPERGNAIKLLTRLMLALPEGMRLISMTGGEAENYNPVACAADVLLPENVGAADIRATLDALLHDIDEEVNEGSQHISLDIQCSEHAEADALSANDTLRLLRLVDLMPSDTASIHPKDGRMTATNNVGQLSLADGAFTLVMSDRGQARHWLNAIERRVKHICGLLDCRLTVQTRYEPWEYVPSSPLKQATADLMRQFYGADMVENICPGGLELCDLLPGLPGLDCVMFAPIGGECHATMEWMDIASFNRVYEFLKTLLGRL